MKHGALAARIALSAILGTVHGLALEDFTVGGSRPVVVHVPPGYVPGSPAPLVLGLHGYTGDGASLESYVRFGPVAASLGILYAHPDGTRDTAGDRFWNATPACCNRYSSSVDDSGYLASVIREIREAVSVDPDRIYVFGHSNGGFMSHRLACDHADTIAAFASIAGATFLDPADCAPPAAVHALQIHGTADEVIHYAGGSMGEFFGIPGWPAYPGAVATVERWAAHNGCALDVGYAPSLDLNAALPGSETAVTRYASGCVRAGSSELWSVQNGNHGPISTASFAEILADWFLKHPKGVATRASFALTPPGGGCPLDVAADASGSTALEGTSVSSYLWDFGDGSSGEGTETTHTYVRPGRHIVTLSITTDTGQSDSAIRPVRVSCPPGDISPWRVVNIGEPAIDGSVRPETPGGVESVHICAGGNSFGATTDSGLLAYQEISGDIAISVRISEIGSTTPGAVVGVMFRDGLAPHGRFAAALVDVSSTADRIGLLRYRYRQVVGQSARSRGATAFGSLPVWLRLERSGTVFLGWASIDGSRWTLIHEQTIDGLPETLLAGVAAAGRDNGSDLQAFVPLQAVVSELSVVPLERFRRGDANGDGLLDISDPLATLGYLFLGTAPPGCFDAADVDDSGALDLADAIYGLMYLFTGGAPPAEPFEDCGADRTRQDDLGCSAHPPCGA